ncbi:hypothetical protein EH220_02155, partial [bacterium]
MTLYLEDLKLAASVDESFDELIDRKQYSLGPLVVLNKLRLGLDDNEQVEFVLAGAIPSDAVEERNLQMLFHKAGFDQVEYRTAPNGRMVSARKRPLYTVPYEYGFSLKELIDEADILKGHEFAREVYYYKDFNYNYEVARQFDPNADLFAVVNSS